MDEAAMTTQGPPRPLRLGDNRVPVYYAGGERISRFRAGDARPDPAGPPAPVGPEDWVGSLSALPPALIPAGHPVDAGVSRTAAGTLTDLVAADPAGWLGPQLAAAYGGQSGLLVKLLDAGERLPVHCHPTRAFARSHLDSLFGKTEGWIILDAEPGATVWLGMADDVDRADLRRWIDRQNAAAMLAAMNELPVHAGDVVYVPAGLPHAIGPGVLLAELQEPTSFSVLAEHEPFGVAAGPATLGLGWDLALSCFDLGGYRNRLAELAPRPRLLREDTSGRVTSLFPAGADGYFRAWRVDCARTVTLPQPSFAVLVVVAGTGELGWDDGALPVTRGQTLVVPAAAGALRFTGTVSVLVCLPPEPA
ncbi:class I mannose-6-phosphate isomerase [Solwaraspora sp. WMMB335]|uniref:class I mannose-6-phosphate isomerase n=1 Tax=Solwaraspora sp. WMMB335 TaxID=3404118 RepID=UPI003B95CFF5